MKVLICDDEPYVLAETKETVMQVFEESEIYDTESAKLALQYAQKQKIDIAFLDIELPGMSGIELAKKLKETNENINIIFVTAYREYAVDAFDLYASGYLMKPLTVEAVRGAVENLRRPVEAPQEKLRVQCFGNFEVFYQGTPLVFARAKAKEVFAYLVDRRGTTATVGELCSVLWEDSMDDERNKHYLRNLLADVRRTLDSCGMGHVFVAKRNSYAILPEYLDCDYYRYLEGDIVAQNSYAGEYMQQYSWAEASFKPQ